MSRTSNNPSELRRMPSTTHASKERQGCAPSIDRRTFFGFTAAISAFAVMPRTAFGSESSSNDQGAPSTTGQEPSIVNFQDQDGTWVIATSETNEYRRVTVTSPTGKSSYFQLDKQSLTIYSSITGETIDAHDAELGQPEKPSTRGLGTVYPIRRSKPIYYYKKYSYAKIKSITNGASNLASIAAGIATLAGAGTAAAILGIIKGISGLVTNINKGSKSHGIKVKFRKVRVYEYHDFQQKWVEINPEITIAGISTY